MWPATREFTSVTTTDLRVAEAVDDAADAVERGIEAVPVVLQPSGEDLDGLKIRVIPNPVFLDTERSAPAQDGAGAVDGQACSSITSPSPARGADSASGA